MAKLFWRKDQSVCGRFCIQTARIRHGRTYEIEYELWQGQGPDGKGPPWKTVWMDGPPMRDIKKKAEEFV